jgi:beta-glucosidase
MFAVTTRDCWNNTWWMDPIFFGKYPADGWELFGRDVPEICAGDMETIRQPLDFFGFNNYQGTVVRADANSQTERVPFSDGYPLTAFRWNVTPDSLYWGARWFYERYRLPVYITENGMSNADVISLDGKVHDPQRIDYTQRYLLALGRAITDGADVRGYFHWSIMDNFEWADGFKERFGMIYVDYPTQKRILKDSAYWYRQVIASNGASLDNI